MNSVDKEQDFCEDCLKKKNKTNPQTIDDESKPQRVAALCRRLLDIDPDGLWFLNIY